MAGGKLVLVKRRTVGRNKKSLQAQVRSNKASISFIKSGIEKKFVYLDRVFGVDTVGPHQFTLNVIEQGTENNKRIGSRVKLMGLNFRFFAQTGTSSLARVLIIWDKQNNNSTALTPLADLLKHVATTTQSLFSVYNSNHVGGTQKERYKILYDSGVINIDADGSPSFKLVNKNIRLGMHTSYTGTDISPADIDDNAISVYTIVNDVNLVYGWSVRLSYMDL